MNENPKLIKLKKSFPAGTVIFKEGSKGNELYLLVSGEIEVQKKGKTVTFINEPGIFIGELAAILKLPRTADLIAKKDSELIVIHSDNFKKVISSSPDIANKLIILLAKRLKATTDSLVEILNNDVNSKDASRMIAQSSCIKLTKASLFEKFSIEDLVKFLRTIVSNKFVTLHGRDFTRVKKESAVFNRVLSEYEGLYDKEAREFIMKLMYQYSVEDELMKKLISEYKLYFTDSHARIIIEEE